MSYGGGGQDQAVDFAGMIRCFRNMASPLRIEPWPLDWESDWV